MNTPTPEDFAAMRAEGSLEEFIDLLTGNRPGSKPAAIAVPEPEPRLPRAGPGAWPTGTSPPGPVAPLPAAVSEAALAEYRQW